MEITIKETVTTEKKINIKFPVYFKDSYRFCYAKGTDFEETMVVSRNQITTSIFSVMIDGAEICTKEEFDKAFEETKKFHNKFITK